MKNILLTFCFVVFYNITYSQTNITNIVDVLSGNIEMDAPAGTYIKDMYNTFTPFLGTWKYQNGNEILTIKLEKVTQYYYSQYGNYSDFIKGNYSYTIDGGLTYITNTISLNVNENNPDINSFYASAPILGELDMVFRDEQYQKSGSATFTFVTGTTNQLHMKLIGWTRGYLPNETIPPAGFSIPNNVVLIKQ